MLLLDGAVTSCFSIAACEANLCLYGLVDETCPPHIQGYARIEVLPHRGLGDSMLQLALDMKNVVASAAQNVQPFGLILAREKIACLCKGARTERLLKLRFANIGFA